MKFNNILKGMAIGLIAAIAILGVSTSFIDSPLFSTDKAYAIIHLSDDAEGGAGNWTLNGFALSTARSASPSTSFRYYGNAAAAKTMTTNNFYHVDNARTRLYFSIWRNIYVNYYYKTTILVEYSTNGTTWVNLQTITSNQTAWESRVIQLGSLAGQDIKIRFKVTNSSYIYYTWEVCIDDIKIQTPPDSNITILENEYSPVTWVNDAIQGTCSAEAADVTAIDVKIKNSLNKWWDGDSWENAESWQPASVNPVLNTWSYNLPASTPGFFTHGYTYTAYPRATDSDGLVEFSPTEYDSFMYDIAVPVTQVVAPQGYTNSNILNVEWIGSDSFSGIQNYDVQYQYESTAWTDVITATTNTSYAFTASNGDGTYSFRSRAIDNLENQEQYPATADLSIILDRQAPNEPINVTLPSASNGLVELTWLEPTDNGPAGIKNYFIRRWKKNGVVWELNYTWEQRTGTSLSETLAEGSWKYDVAARDNANNLSLFTTSEVCVIDKTAPSLTTISINNGDTITNSQTINLSLSAYDNGTGVAEMQFRHYDVGGWDDWETPVPYSTSYQYTMTAVNNSHTIRVRFFDAAGNESASRDDAIYLDTKAPEGSLQFKSLTNGYVTSITSKIDPNCSDIYLNSYRSGMDKMRFSNDGINWPEGWVTYSAADRNWDLIPGDGPKTVFAQYKDVAGNTSEVYPTPTILDTTGPINCSVVIDNNETYSRDNYVNLTLSATDETSGVRYYRISNDGITWTGTYTFNPASPIFINWRIDAGYGGTSANGTKTVYVEFRDWAGQNTVVTDTIVYDNVRPLENSLIINADGTADGIHATNTIEVVLTLSATDNMSGVASMEFHRWDTPFEGNWEPYSATKAFKIPGDRDCAKFVYYRVSDNAGLYSTDSITGTTGDYIVLDRVAPTSETSTTGVFNSATWYGIVFGYAFEAIDHLDNPTVDPVAGVSTVEVTLKRLNDNYYWNGTTWDSAITWLKTSGSFAENKKSPAIWLYSITASNFDPTQPVTYEVQSRATDYAGNVELSPASNTFIFDDSAPSSTIDMLPAYSNDNWNSAQIKGTAGAGTIGLNSVWVRLYYDYNSTNYMYWNGTSFQLRLKTQWTDTFGWQLATITGDTWEYNNSDPDLLNLINGKSYIVQSKAIDNNASDNEQYPFTTDTFVYDNSNPNASLTAPSGGIYSGFISFEGTATDNSSIKLWRISYGPDILSRTFLFSGSMPRINESFGIYNSEGPSGIPDGTYSFYLDVEDWAGNIVTAEQTGVTIDNSSPVTSVQITSGTAGNIPWYITPVKFVFNVNDVTTKETFYRINSSGSYTSYDILAPIKPEIELNTEGLHIIEFYSTDMAGNTEMVKSYDIQIDSVNPASLISLEGEQKEPASGWYTNDVEIEITGSDATSGLAQIMFGINATPASINYLAPFIMDANGTHTIYYFAQDVAGNNETEKQKIVKIDKEFPNTTAQITSGTLGDNNIYITPVTVQLTPTDSVSGINQTYYQITYNYAPLTNGTGTTVNIGANGDGIYGIIYNSMDVAGNEEDEKVLYINIDQNEPTPPMITAPNSGVNFTTDIMNFVLEGTCPNDTETILINSSNGNISNIALNQADNTWSANIAIGIAEGSYIFNVSSKDLAGNESLNDSITITLDTIGPVITLDEPVTPTKFTTALLEGTTENATDTVYVELNNGSAMVATMNGTDWSLSINLIPNSFNSITVWAEDAVGNIGPEITAEIEADQLAPATPTLNVVSPTNSGSQTVNGIYTSNDTVQVEVKVYYEEITPAGFQNVYPVNVSGFIWNETILFGADGVYYVMVNSIDDAGNYSLSPIIKSIVYDSSNPIVDENALIINNNAEFTNTRSATLEINADASDLSGVVSVKVRNVIQGTPESWTAFEYDTDNNPWNPWMLSGFNGQDGIRTVEAYFTDNAGNDSDIVSTDIIYDSTAPEINVIAINGFNMLDEELAKKNPGIDHKVIRPNPTIEVEATDANDYTIFTDSTDNVEVAFIDGNDSIIPVLSGTSGNSLQYDTTIELPAGEYTLRVTVIDNAGNETIEEINGVTVVGGDPVITSQVIPAPNPFNPPLDGPDPNNTMKIYFTVAGDPTAIVAVYIHDTAGRLVWKEKYTAQELLDNSGIEWTGYLGYNEIAENGVYLVRIIDETNKKLIGKTKVIIIKKK